MEKHSPFFTANYIETMHRMYNSQQIANIAETNYRTERMANKKDVATTHYYGYDANGNQLFVNTGTLNALGQLQVTDTRRMLWDEDNHLLAVSDNGFVSNYWYDAAGERTVKETGDGEGVNINGAVSAGRTGTSNFTVYVNPYTVINNGGQMSKHIYVGGERILSKLCDAGSMADPTKDTTACAKNFTAKYADLTGRVKMRFDSLGVAYFGKDNKSSNTYYKASTGSTTPSLYYFHADHLGSASLITDGAGHLNQHLAYIPNGEVFVNQQFTSFDSRYKFSGKEMDAETGLYYFSQRYMDPKSTGFISSDPLREKYPNISSYVYCHNNPLSMIDPDGMADFNVKSSTGDISLAPPPTNYLNPTANNSTQYPLSVPGQPDNYYIVDDQGNRTGASYTLQNGSTTETFYKSVKYSTGATEITRCDAISVSGDAEGKGLYEFLSNNTHVEWGRLRTGETSEGTNIITTSHTSGSDISARSILYRLAKNNVFLREYIHDHPDEINFRPSLSEVDRNGNPVGDKGNALWIENNFPGAGTSVYSPIYKTYIIYDSKGIKTKNIRRNPVPALEKK